MTTTDPTDDLLSRPETAKGRLQRAVLELLREHDAAGELPTSNRFLFYELVQAGVLDKSRTRRAGRGADQDLSDASKHLRDVGLVPWEWIVDETRTVTAYTYAPSVAEYLSGAVERATLDRWAGDPPPLILTESRTFGGVLTRTVAAEYLVPVAATNGQVGGFLRTNLAPLLGGDGTGRRVLYVGDLDHQGAQIEANTRRELERAAGAELAWTRVALTAAQADEHDLPRVEKLDRRYRPPRPGWAVEVEALGQGTVTGLVRSALDGLLPEPLDVVEAREDAERAEWRAKLKRRRRR